MKQINVHFVLPFCCVLCAQEPPPEPPLAQVQTSIQKQWYRDYTYRIQPGEDLELESAFASWAVGPINIGDPRFRDLWIEYIPIQGPSKWSPSGVYFGEEVPPFGPKPGLSGDFRVVGNEDGRGLRLWDKTRTKLIAQHFFDNLSPKDLDIRLEATPEGGLLIQASHPAKPRIFVDVRYSLDGDQWSYPRHTVLFANPAHRRAPEKREDFRLPSVVLAKNAKPWVEVDVMLGLYRVRKRFQYGVSNLPLKDGVLPSGRQSEFKHGQLERDQKARDDEFKEQRESMDKGLPWTPKPKRVKLEEELLLDWGEIIQNGK